MTDEMCKCGHSKSQHGAYVNQWVNACNMESTYNNDPCHCCKFEAGDRDAIGATKTPRENELKKRTLKDALDYADKLREEIELVVQPERWTFDYLTLADEVDRLRMAIREFNHSIK